MELTATTWTGRDYISLLSVLLQFFTAVDLAQRLKLDGRYDLAVCLEVAERLDARSGNNLVATLTDLAPLILFSAAVPGQGGIGHVNEQWPQYWRCLFEERGFKMLDLIRPLIREDRRVDWWYPQNIVMFAGEAAIAATPTLRITPRHNQGIEWIHINMLCPPHAGVRNIPVHLRPVLGQAIKNRIPWNVLSRVKSVKRLAG